MISKLDEVVEEEATNSEIVPSATVPSREVPSKEITELSSANSSKRKTIPEVRISEPKVGSSIEGIAKASDKIGRAFTLNTNRSLKKDSLDQGTIGSDRHSQKRAK